MASSRVIVANAPPATTARPSRLRRPRAISAMLATAAIDAPTAMMRRCPAPLIGARPSFMRKCTLAAGTMALAAISRRFDPAAAQDPVHPCCCWTFCRGLDVSRGVIPSSPLPIYRREGGLRQAPGRAAQCPAAGQNLTDMGVAKMRVAMTEHAVVIAGGGPTGLMLAGELALAGVDVAIVERRASQDLPGSRAGGLHSRTIEILDQRGIADRFLSEGQVAQVGQFSGRPSGHQRLSHPASLHARALAEPHRAHPRRLGR